jgi:hypothetical protein
MRGATLFVLRFTGLIGLEIIDDYSYILNMVALKQGLAVADLCTHRCKLL